MRNVNIILRYRLYLKTRILRLKQQLKKSLLMRIGR